jgi:VWFA-related protein
MPSTPWRCGALLLAGLALGPARAYAQAASPRPPQVPLIVGVDVDVVSLPVVIYDKAGRFVDGLGPKDIEIYEDGVRQEISYFRAATGGDERIPLSVVLVLDASGSMKENLRFLQEAATSFVRKLDPADSALVVQFNDSIKASAEFTSDSERLEDFVDALQAWGGTSLYDAIHYALGRIKDQPGRKALVVFSDGADTTSALKERDAIDYARAVEATIYSVAIEGFGAGGSARGFLRKVAEETGGQYFFPSKVGELIRVFAAIADELRHHYALAYTPARAPDGGWRAIQVKLARADTTVRVRKGYFAVKRRPRGADTPRSGPADAAPRAH